MQQSDRSPPIPSAGYWTPLSRLVVGLCFLLNMLDGADLLVMSFVAPILSQRWKVGPEQLGVLFSASLAGMAIGCLAVAPFADRFGRRRMILGALALVATAMIVSGATRSVAELMMARLLVGIGVGTIGVSMTAMAAEFAPEHARPLAIGLVQAGWPFAAILTALVAVHLPDAASWQALFVGIGVLSVILFALIAAFLPESVAFTVARGGSHALDRTNRLLGRLCSPPLAALPPTMALSNRIPLGRLFASGRARSTILLWIAVTFGYFVLYFVISWIPKLAVQAGLAIDNAIYAGATYNLGAFVGTVAVGALAIRFRLERVVATFLLLAAVALLMFGGLTMSVGLTLTMAFAVGATVQGGFNGFWGLAARLYSAEIRGTGVGWALGVGRVGAVAGPIVGGLLVGKGASVGLIFSIYAVPLVIAAVLTLGVDRPGRAAKIA